MRLELVLFEFGKSIYSQLVAVRALMNAFYHHISGVWLADYAKQSFLSIAFLPLTKGLR